MLRNYINNLLRIVIFYLDNVKDESTGNLFYKWCIQLVRRRLCVLRYVKNLC
jgi:hypothetical protein